THRRQGDRRVERAHVPDVPPGPPGRAAGRRPGHPERDQDPVPAAEDPRCQAHGEDREAMAPVPDARVPLPLELAGQRPGLAGSRGQTDAPQLGSSSATRKEEPQPQEATTFGFETSKPEPWKLSVKSTVEPSTYCMLAGSTSTRMPAASKTWSSERFSSSASAYWNPEQPPPLTPTRRPTSPSAPWPAMNSCTFCAAMSVSVTICFANCIGATVGTLKGTCQAQKSFATA